ncbi:integrase [Pectobacterium odoriferum]|uniref:Integrase n=1 Tax=Pectobacterium odoriferum TaxID=78398 RepID=A0ABD6VTI9_9GAMM|nr:integrase domain-containing protein [Pectobacterium odoriferum]POD98132.1 integrase [Pectobacterium odoriferum]POE14992.1 integrase [Pectobacterium odoriferum]POE28051.1 integrase [Pectobacterium odoriferum]POE33199.1 integrase [Pectobacterium odoriferum]POE41841.1 integrase [Pectobacterium odoriferum]
MAIQAKPLTNTEVKAAKAIDKELSLHDGGGLLLFVKPSGKKTWRFRYYHPQAKKRTTLTFGSYPAISLADARQMREAAKALLEKNIDPQFHQQQQREQEQAINLNTFAKVSADWYEVKKSQPLAENTIKDIWRSLEKYVFPFIGTLPITQLTARHFITALEPIQASGKLETVKRVSQRVNEVMDYAVNSGLIPANPAAKIRKAFQTPVKTHMPTIRPEALPGLMKTLSVASIELQTRLLIEWQLLTVTRPAEAAETRWSEINLTDNTWTIPAGRMKMRRDHVIPLPPQALAILDAMKPISGHREYLFPSSKDPKQPMNSQTANAALRRMGYKGVLVSHGLRAIFSTAANEEGFPPDVIEAALAHVDTNEVRRAYNRSTYLEQRKILMCWWGEFVETAASGKVMASEGARGLRAVND